MGNLDKIPMLVFEKSTSCHNSDKMCRTKYRIPSYSEVSNKRGGGRNKRGVGISGELENTICEKSTYYYNFMYCTHMLKL